ncbi:MAG: elongation factor G [Candidatus Omnitrophica bacterium]|nr:elongation factor G [Candidatus Omnitrophota bacterium]
MVKFEPQNIRNVAIVSHSGAGKTTLAEAILYRQKAVTRQGTVTEGNTVSDYDPIEIARKISINVSLVHAVAAGTKINIIDTPGYADFILELRNALPAADAALVLVSAPEGVQVGTQRVWDLVADVNMPSAIFVSKLDKENTEFSQSVAAIQETLGGNCLPAVFVSGTAANCKAVASLVTKNGWEKLSAAEQKQAEKMRETLMERVAEVDDALVEKYLNGEPLAADEFKKALRCAMQRRTVIPIFGGNPTAQLGIDELIDGIVDDFPAPGDRPAQPAADPDSKAEKKMSWNAGTFAAFVFKTISDPYVGQLSLFRIISGQLASNTEFYNVSQAAAERIGQIYVLQGKEQLPVDAVGAGDIAAVAKLKNTHTGDSLSDSKAKVLFNTKVEMEPAISFSLKPKTRQDEEKISQSLAKLTTEDQGIRVSRDAQTKELILSGMGDMHLEITIERLKLRYHVEVEVGTPKVPYKETIRKPVKIQGKYKKQSGGRGQYGDVWLELHPLERGKQFEFVDKVVGGAVPRQYIPSVEKGVRRAMEEGALAGYPLVDVKVTIYDGSYHEVDSSDMAFQIAGSMALKKGVLEANPVLLEPVMHVEIVVPGDVMGAINGDLSSRRGRVQGMEAVGKYEKISAQVPLAEMLRYATDLRSMTQGQGSYTMSFSHYEEVPARVAEKIVAQAKIEHEHEEHHHH